MNNRLLYAPEDTPALKYALEELDNRGIGITREPCEKVTHLLLINALQNRSFFQKNLYHWEQVHLVVVTCYLK